MSTSPCAHPACQSPATHRAELVVYAIGVTLHEPAIGHIGLYVCTAHATEETARTLLNDATKQQITQSFVERGRAKPDWRYSFVRWKALEESPYDRAV